MAWDYPDKSAARQWVWDRLAAEGVARFPFPAHGRIPLAACTQGGQAQAPYAPYSHEDTNDRGPDM
jgi:hypothetical protein